MSIWTIAAAIVFMFWVGLCVFAMFGWMLKTIDDQQEIEYDVDDVNDDDVFESGDLL